MKARAASGEAAKAETAAAYNERIKLPRYAATNIPEYWLVRLHTQQVMVCRGPDRGLYDEIRIFGRGETLAPLALPGVTIAVDDLLAPVQTR